MREKPTSPEYGLIPPQALDLEEMVIGSIIYEQDCFETVLGIINADCFYKETHQILFNACNELFKAKKAIDILTVKNYLTESKQIEQCGGIFAISQLTAKVGSTANIEFHCRIILEKYMRREIIRIGQETAKRGYDESDDIFELIEEARLLIDCIDNISNNELTFRKMDSLLKEKREKLKELRDSPEPLSGISTGFESWDAFCGGLHAPDLIVIAGRPGMGKTLVARNISSNVAERMADNECFLVFALEEGMNQYAENVIASETFIDKDRIKRLQLTDTDFTQMEYQSKKFEGKNYFIDDTPGISIQAIERKCRKISKKFKIKAVMIDYLQLCTTSSKNGNREQEISEISRGAKGICKKFDCPVIALSQLSREVEKTSSKRPTLAHLRESGAIEQDADIVIFPFRPEYYGMKEYVGDTEYSDTTDLILIEFAKHRNGQLGEFPMKVDLKTNNLLNYKDQIATTQRMPVDFTQRNNFLEKEPWD